MSAHTYSTISISPKNPATQGKPAVQEPEVNEELAQSHGLNREEYERILRILRRKPSFTELGVFSVMWSEHCSYKSSRLHLKKLPVSAPWVIQGPGENAGVIDIGDGQAAVFKMESHNHPSFIEPYQGAATGVGGIMRDVFTMGARPIANINALRFGDPSHPRTRHLMEGVVAGISGYGNCMGVPTVAGETDFHVCYNDNILVNAMTIGIAETEKIFYARGATSGQPVVYVGAKTGRDGIHGATMASAAFDEDSDQKRPTVQVGDPFTEKLLLEACLELMQKDAIVSIQDMGAAGLTSSTVEIAQKGNIGVFLDLDQVPQREQDMLPYEIMLSESQERMLMILKPGKEKMAKTVFDKWDLDFAVIGHTTDTGRLIVDMYGKRWCDIAVPPLVDEAPVYDRPAAPPSSPVPLINIATAKRRLQKENSRPGGLHNSDNGKHEQKDRKKAPRHLLLEALEIMLAAPEFSSKKWVWEQYDSLVSGRTVFSPGICDTQTHKGGDAALIRVPTASNAHKALAVSSDCTPRYCQADPYSGGMQAVCESYRNISATGALPLAITNNLNFGNPEKPEIMAQLKGCIEGMAHACGQLHYPVVSGNVSLYNETIDQNIYPTPAIGGVGIIDDYRKALPMAFQRTDEHIFLVGKTHGHLGQSLFIKILYDSESGAPPPCDPVVELRHGAFIRELAETGLASACHDLSDGGLMMALAEMAMAGEIGARIHVANEKPEFWFGEDQGRYLLVTSSADAVIALAQKKNIPLTLLGRTAGDCLVIGDDDPDQKATHKVDMKKNIPSSAPPQERPLSSWKQIIQISVTELRCLHEKFFDEYFND